MNPLSAEATVELLQKAKLGDESALDRLLEPLHPALRRWAHGRMPTSARGMLDTADLVQDAVMSRDAPARCVRAEASGALQAYLRKAVLNRIRDIAAAGIKRGLDQTDLPDNLADERTSPLEQAIGQENLARYEAAMQRLGASDREAIVARLELQQSYDELAVIN